MMLGLLGQRSEVDVFLYYLGTQLGKSVVEIEALPYAEVESWRAYFIAKHAIENQKKVTA